MIALKNTFDAFFFIMVECPRYIRRFLRVQTDYRRRVRFGFMPKELSSSVKLNRPMENQNIVIDKVLRAVSAGVTDAATAASMMLSPQKDRQLHSKALKSHLERNESVSPADLVESVKAVRSISDRKGNAYQANIISSELLNSLAHSLQQVPKSTDRDVPAPTIEPVYIYVKPHKYTGEEYSHVKDFAYTIGVRNMSNRLFAYTYVEKIDWETYNKLMREGAVELTACQADKIKSHYGSTYARYRSIKDILDECTDVRMQSTPGIMLTNPMAYPVTKFS